jgi:hypothetical protein
MKLGYMMLLVAVGAMLVIAPSAMAGEKGKGHDKNAVYGKVTAVGADSITVAVQGKKDAPAAEPKVITTTEKTTIVLASKGADGKIEEKPGTMADVKVDARVAVTLAEDKTAAKVVIMPAGGGKGGHEKKAPK